MSMAVKDKCIDKRLSLVKQVGDGCLVTDAGPRSPTRQFRDFPSQTLDKFFSSCIDMVSKISVYEKTTTSLNVPNLMGQQGPDIVQMKASFGRNHASWISDQGP